jgi:DNA-binding transcriptional ArsR family regulator
MENEIKIVISNIFETPLWWRKTNKTHPFFRETKPVSRLVTVTLIRPVISYSFEMTDRRKIAASPAEEQVAPGVPEEVAASLCACGGIEGLVALLPSEAELERLSARHRACADPIRLKILAMLAVQPLCVCVIKAVLGIADSKLSYHLGVLKKAGLIAGEQQGSWIIYSLTTEGRGWTGR